mgnify:CR=1 FL=1
MVPGCKELSIYIHIPFCIRKCLYCDFLSVPAAEEVRERYVDRLVQEIREESEKYRKYNITSVFFGGGTPSLLDPWQITRLMDGIREHYRLDPECEISIEANPGTVSADKVKAWKSAGINRVSIGVQSLVDEELRLLGRIHTSRDFYQTYELVAKSGFTNINLDLMTGIPGQSKESCLTTLKAVERLEARPVHISAYSLIIEEGTPFYENCPALPEEETEREIYKITSGFLAERGYWRYEISNYALPGFACRHNQVYWRRGNYAGFGIGAASMVENVRFSNGRDLKAYFRQGPEKEQVQRLSKEEQMEEYMFLGLRMTEGVSLQAFRETFGKELDQIYPGIVEKYQKEGLLKYLYTNDGQKSRVALTEFGMDVSNVVMADFLLT